MNGLLDFSKIRTAIVCRSNCTLDLKDSKTAHFLARPFAPCRASSSSSWAPGRDLGLKETFLPTAPRTQEEANCSTPETTAYGPARRARFPTWPAQNACAVGLCVRGPGEGGSGPGPGIRMQFSEDHMKYGTTMYSIISPKQNKVGEADIVCDGTQC